MIAQQGTALTFYAFFTESKVGKTGLTVTVDIYEATTGTPIIADGSATELAGGLYYYTLSGASVDADGAYISVFKTATATVDQQHLPSVWSVGNVVSADVVSMDADTVTASALATDAVAEINATVDTAISDAALATAANLATVDTNVDAILVDTGTDIPATLSTIAGYIDTEVAAIQTAVDALNDLDAAGIRTAVGLASANLDTQLSTIDTVVDSILVDTGALNDTALPDSVPADGSLPTLKQAVYMIAQFLTERSVSGTTVTVKKADGSTSLMTFTLDDASSPTSITRAS